jgi:transcriptional regulator of acetoin/glycerol metabolism
MDSTADSSGEYLRERDRFGSPTPGLAVVVEAGQPAARGVVLQQHGLEVGRGAPDGILADDEQVSRTHLRVAYAGGIWTFEDLGSRNGTFIDGVRLSGSVKAEGSPLIRIGRSLLWAVPDVRPYRGHAMLGVPAPAPVVGGTSRRVLGEIALLSKASENLLIMGESGSGKELLARAFHEAQHGQSGRAPLVAVNCAAIPEGLAERLLFGAKRGAYSGATDAEGYVQQAHGGTLFLDEIAELDPLVQAKLLRVVETREVMPLGATQSKRVSFRLCAATHKDLRAEVHAGRFREDLYYRMGRPEVRNPPLRERVDEMPWLVQRAMNEVDPKLTAQVTTYEQVALLKWPGNVRELLHEARQAAHAALHEGVDVVRPDHFAKDAGMELGPASGESTQRTDSTPSARHIDDDEIERVLAEHSGNVTAAAKALGLHRNQLRRWVDKRTGTKTPAS